MALHSTSPPPLYIHPNPSDIESRIAKLEEIIYQQQLTVGIPTSDASCKTCSQKCVQGHEAIDRNTSTSERLKAIHLQRFEETPQHNRIITLRDAVGRRYTFPYLSCTTWKGMASLITQRFKNIDILGPHIETGHYEITTGPNIVSPEFWEESIMPGQYFEMWLHPIPNKLVNTEWPHVFHIADKSVKPYPVPPGPSPGPPLPWMGRPNRAPVGSSKRRDVHRHCGLRGVWNRVKRVFKRKNKDDDSDTSSISSIGSLIDD